jgi:AcrR family transcriptional regulator
MSAASLDTDKASAPRSRKGAATRARLVEAAKAVFEDAGFLDARVSDIAERAGLSHGSFYHYFDSKEQVFREVAQAINDELSAGMALVLDRASTATPQERLRAALRLHFEAYRAEAKMMGVIEQVSRHDDEVRQMRQEHRARHGQLVAASIEQLQKRGMADPSIDAHLASVAVGAMTWQFAEQWLIHGVPDVDFDTGVEQFTKVFVNALQLRDRPTATS